MEQAAYTRRMSPRPLSKSDRRSAAPVAIDGSAWQPDYDVRWVHADDSVGVARWRCDGSHHSAGGEEEVPRFVEFNLQTRGAHVRTIGRRAHVVEPLQQSLWPCGSAYRLSENIGRAQSATLVFAKPETLDQVLADVAGTHAGTLRHLLGRPATIRSDAVAIAHARLLGASGALAREEFVLGLMRTFLTAALDRDGCRHAPSLTESVALRRGMAFAASHFRESLSLRRIAREAGLSASRFSAIFARETGAPVWRYVMDLRLQDALRLLAADTDSDIASLALELGFNSHSHFSTAFRTRYGCTPTAFRRGRDGVAQTARRA